MTDEELANGPTTIFWSRYMKRGTAYRLQSPDGLEVHEIRSPADCDFENLPQWPGDAETERRMKESTPLWMENIQRNLDEAREMYTALAIFEEQEP